MKLTHETKTIVTLTSIETSYELLEALKKFAKSLDSSATVDYRRDGMDITNGYVMEIPGEAHVDTSQIDKIVEKVAAKEYKEKVNKRNFVLAWIPALLANDTGTKSDELMKALILEQHQDIIASKKNTDWDAAACQIGDFEDFVKLRKLIARGDRAKAYAFYRSMDTSPRERIPDLVRDLIIIEA